MAKTVTDLLSLNWKFKILTIKTIIVENDFLGKSLTVNYQIIIKVYLMSWHLFLIVGKKIIISWKLKLDNVSNANFIKYFTLLKILKRFNKHKLMWSIRHFFKIKTRIFIIAQATWAIANVLKHNTGLHERSSVYIVTVI